MKLATALILSSVALLLLTGCPQGTAPMNSVANPQTLVEIDPSSRKMKVFTNDGRSLRADEITFEKGDTRFVAKNLNISERSVENRGANVDQIGASMPYLLAQQETLNRLIATAGGVLRQAAIAPSTEIGFNPTTGQATFTRGATPVAPPEPYTPAPIIIEERSPTDGAGSASPPVSANPLAAPSVIIPTAAQPSNPAAVPPSAATMPAVASPPISAADKAALIESLRREKAALVAASDRPTARELEIDELLAVLGAR